MVRNSHWIGFAIAIAWLPLAASPVRTGDACPAGCAQGDLACTAAAALCEMKLRAFEVYTQQIDARQPKHALPPIYRDVLREHYPDADLEQVRFAFSDQQPPDNATTICNEIYFNDARYVAALRDGGPNQKWLWLLHELTHVEQCARGGGREPYALRWWSELETAVRESGETIDVFQTSEELARQLQALYVRVHGAMPMERAADAKAEAVLANLRQCCLAEDGTLTRPSGATP